MKYLQKSFSVGGPLAISQKDWDAIFARKGPGCPAEPKRAEGGIQTTPDGAERQGGEARRLPKEVLEMVQYQLAKTGPGRFWAVDYRTARTWYVVHGVWRTWPVRPATPRTPSSPPGGANQNG